MGQPIAYTVYVDESFKDFMNLASLDGFFAYLALMLPDSGRDDLSRFWVSFEERVKKQYHRATGHYVSGEFKSNCFRKLSVCDRRNNIDRIGRFISKHDGYIAGVYTTARALLAEKLRTEMARDTELTQLPADWETRLEEVKRGFLDDKVGEHGETALLRSLFHLGVGIPHQWLSNLGVSFRVQYDPRNKKEDASLIKHIDMIFERMAVRDEKFRTYLGASNKIPSSASEGLQMTDILLGEMRFLFEAVPALTKENSGPKLIKLDSLAENPVHVSIFGQVMPWGIRKPFSRELSTRFREGREDIPFLATSRRLADEKLSCYATCGENRIINLRASCFEEMVD